MKHALLLLLFPFNLFAQGIFISPHISFNKTGLYNKEDKKENNKLLWMMPTYTPQYGIDIGWSFEREKAGLSSISLGINYAPIHQKYEGVYYIQISSLSPKTTAITKLHYLSVPVNVEFTLMKAKRIVPIVQLGVDINYLISYSDVFTYDMGKDADGNNIKHELTIKNDNYKDDNKPMLSGAVTANLNKWYYKKFVVSAHAGLGAKFIITEKMNIVILAKGSYGFNDAENKTPITYSANSTYSIFKPPVTWNPYERNYAKVTQRKYYAQDETRGASHINSIGIQIGFNYKLFNTNKQHY